MSTHRAARILGALLLTAVGSLLGPVAPAPAHAADQRPPQHRAYVYRATFTVEITHHVRLEYYYEGDGKFIDASASLSGRIPSVTLVPATPRARIAIDTLGSTVKAISGAVDSTETSGHGQTEVRCQGSSIWKTDKEHAFVVTGPEGGAYFRAFSILSLPQTCRDNHGSEPTTSVHSFPELAAPLVVRSSKIGDKHIAIPFSAERTYPRAAGQDKDCPNSAQSLTKECTYTVQGTIRLTRTGVKRLR